MKNSIKIAVTPEQNTYDIVDRLSDMGYESCLMSWYGYGYIVAESSGEFSDYTEDHDWMKEYPLVTLVELNEM